MGFDFRKYMPFKRRMPPLTELTISKELTEMYKKLTKSYLTLAQAYWKFYPTEREAEKSKLKYKATLNKYLKAKEQLETQILKMSEDPLIRDGPSYQEIMKQERDMQREAGLK